MKPQTRMQEQIRIWCVWEYGLQFPKLREAFLDSYRERAYNHTFVVAQ